MLNYISLNTKFSQLYKFIWIIVEFQRPQRASKHYSICRQPNQFMVTSPLFTRVRAKLCRFLVVSPPFQKLTNCNIQIPQLSRIGIGNASADVEQYWDSNVQQKKKLVHIAERSFDLRTFGLWAQHAVEFRWMYSSVGCYPLRHSAMI